MSNTGIDILQGKKYDLKELIETTTYSSYIQNCIMTLIKNKNTK